MRYLVLTDIHANLEALEAVLAAAPPDEVDDILVLGDLVGYGADPNAVVDRVRGLAPRALIRGNHDKVASGLEEPEGFNATARAAVRWTHDTLTPANRQYVAGLPVGPVFVDSVVEGCHGTPYDEDEYMFEELDALRSFEAMRRQVCLFGHTHVPVVYSLTADVLETEHTAGVAEMGVALRAEHRYLINPGSVGQPRDGDPRAAYGILDVAAKQMRLHRIDYPIEVAQQKILSAGLPPALAHRLALGR